MRSISAARASASSASHTSVLGKTSRGSSQNDPRRVFGNGPDIGPHCTPATAGAHHP